LIAPGLVASFLLGAALSESGATLVARICGAALIAIGIACWSSREDPQSSSAGGLIYAMLFYNLIVATLLAYGWIGLGLRGLGLWPAVLAHLTLALWAFACVRSPRPDGTSQ
jgi:hypothetical protein